MAGHTAGNLFLVGRTIGGNGHLFEYCLLAETPSARKLERTGLNGSFRSLLAN
jgi:hypothetical protein